MRVGKSKKESAYTLFTWILFSALFLYLFLRAYYVEPIHDEVATFFHYIETGVFWGEKAILDANNHLLNSYLSRQLYLWFGPHFFFLRLPNVLAFAVYFWSIVQLVKPFEKRMFRTIVLVAIVGIPFILEYFAYTRGYGISLAFFFGAIVYLKKYVQTLSLIHLLVAYLCLIIAVYANLTYLISCILAIGFVLVHQLLAWKKVRFTQQISFLFSHGLLVCAIFPAIQYAEILKEGGALYYGSLNGFWEVTGLTLTQYTLFFIQNGFKWILLLLGLLLLFALVWKWLKKGKAIFFHSKELVIAWFLFGHIGAILFLAHFRGVNYPEDRVGMYLIPLSILLLAYILNERKWSSFGLFGLLIFPVLFIPRINLSTSVFSRDDRFSDRFYNPIRQEIKPESTLSGYPLMHMTWARQNRKASFQNTMSIEKTFNAAADFILTKDVLEHDKNELSFYDTLCRDLQSGFMALKRKKAFVKTVIFDSTFSISQTEGEFIGFGSFFVPDSLRNQKMQIRFTANVQTNAKYTHTSIVYSTFDKNFNSKVYEAWNVRWLVGMKSSFPINFNYPIDQFDPEEQEVRVYLWNPEKEKVAIKNGKFEIISLD